MKRLSPRVSGLFSNATWRDDSEREVDTAKPALDSPMRSVERAFESLARAPSAFAALTGEPGSGRAHFARELARRTHPGGRFVLLEASSSVERLRALAFELKSRPAPSGFDLHVREVGAASEAFQSELAILCRALRRARSTARVTVSASAPLADGVQQGWLRPDLGYHFPALVELPPLRSRREELPALIRLVAERASERLVRATPRFSGEALERLCAHDWPQNLAELERVVERALALANADSVAVEDLPPLELASSRVEFQLPAEGLNWSELEQRVLEQALARTGNNQSRAAALVGLSRDQMRYRLAKFGIGVH
ncbi:MAG TPA: helix-turn-helix domain-containing protein [Polyangiaceae bacterium]